jgi:hypothetical protein
MTFPKKKKKQQPKDYTPVTLNLTDSRYLFSNI